MKGKYGVDIPLYYVKFLKENGGILNKSHRIEIFLDESKIGCEAPYITDYYLNVKKTMPPDFEKTHQTTEYQIRKFKNSETRNEFSNILKENIENNR